MSSKLRALVLEDEELSRELIARLLKDCGFEATTASSLKAARKLLGAGSFELILVDLQLPDGSGLDLIAELKGRSDTQVAVITGHASLESVSAALNLGACDYLSKPLEVERLKVIAANVRKLIDRRQDADDLRAQLRTLGQFGPMVGASPPMQQVYDLMTMVAPTQASVLIQGESGTGKELVAQTLHLLSPRRGGPFVPVNCGAVAPTLMESELFGHEKGSFTGAEKLHRGAFERAAEGTLFLDEVTEMPLDLQVKLLRVLESGELLRVGGDAPVKLSCRVVAATNRVPERAIAEGKLREDLFYRLNVFPLRLPPLRERGGDAVLLAGAFLSSLNREAGSSKRLTEDALRNLLARGWPGNVRELKNTLQRAFIIAGEEITAEHLADGEPRASPEAEPEPGARPRGDRLTLEIGISLAEAKERLIDATLAHFQGDKRKASKALGISVRTLYYRISERTTQGAPQDAGSPEPTTEA